LLANLVATCNAISFSLYPFPLAPESCPPCPGSTTIVYFLFPEVEYLGPVGFCCGGG